MNFSTQTHVDNYIALLGFANPAYETLYPNNSLLAYQAGEEIVRQGFGLAVGNTTSTFRHALNGAANANGNSLLILEQQPSEASTHYHHQENCKVQLAGCTNEKHQHLVNNSAGGIVIGGGYGTLHLIEQFLMARKPVVAISCSGGVVANELSSEVIMMRDIKDAVLLIRMGGLVCRTLPGA